MKPTTPSLAAGDRSERPDWQRWGFALAMLALATGIRVALADYFGGVPLATFYSAVAFTVWFSGWLPATAVMVAGYFIGLGWFWPQTTSWRVWETFGVFRTLTYVVSTATTIVLGETMRRAQRRAAASEARIASVLEQMAECFCSVDREWRITHLNRSAALQLNISPQGARGRLLWELMPGLALDTALRHAMTQNTSVKFETDAIIPQGWASLSATPSPDGLSIFFHDITARKTQFQQLEQQVAERTATLQGTIADLEAFSYTLVHDMRAPLRSVGGYAAVLAADYGGQLDPKARAHLDRIEKAARRMDKLIEDVLTYSRLGRQTPPLHAVDLHALLHDILESYPQFQSTAADIRIEGELPHVRGNEALLTQCFSNLIHNAIKFVAPGVRPRVRIFAEPAGESCRVLVEDNGIGISIEAVSRIFEPFRREDPRYEGTGIGLAIVRKVVEQMGGSVGVQSALGQGSRFWIELRRADLASALALTSTIGVGRN